MAIPERPQMEALRDLFEQFTLNDQRNYYRATINRYRNSAFQVNAIRAGFSLLTGVVSALAGLLVQSAYNSGQCVALNTLLPGSSLYNFCAGIGFVVGVLMITAVVAPAFGGAFGTLADLYQWDRLVTIYEASLENIEVAEARAPDREMDDGTYWASLVAFTQGTLDVMRDETAQWGQLIRTPDQLDKFIEQAQKRAAQLEGGQSGQSGQSGTGASAPSDSGASNTGASGSAPNAPSVPSAPNTPTPPSASAPPTPPSTDHAAG